MTTEELLFKSTISSPKARFMCCDINNFYLVTPMERYEYICLTLNIITEEIIEQYNLRDMEKMGMSMMIFENECTASHKQDE